jgi:zinc and cadmium transporter
VAGFSHEEVESRGMVVSYAMIVPNTLAAVSLGTYLLLIATAAFAGGATMAFFSLGHRRMQVLLSLTAGVMLGVGLLHLLPHAFYELGRDIDTTAAWVLAGFFLMFLLERAFHGHAHHTADGDLATQAAGDGHGHHHHHGHGRGHSHAEPSGVSRPARWAWLGAFAGLSLHSLADGAALAASVNADAVHGTGLLAGFATFLAVLLHKPFDAGIIATLMVNAHASSRLRLIVNGLYAAVVPLGAVCFLASLRLFGEHQGDLLGIALAMAAGAFLCIAAADLLPEVQFHSHDRVLLTVSLAIGLTIAWGITTMEQVSHGHAAHTHALPSVDPAAPHAH